MKESELKIVADGGLRLRLAKDFISVRRRILSEVTQRYIEEKRGASFWRRVLIEIRIHREVREALKREFPPSALYLAIGATATEPNQSLEPTSMLGTSAAEPPRVPSTLVAHL